MALEISSLSQVCRTLGQVVGTGINVDTVEVVIGTPAAAATLESDGKHRLNLFFFRFEPPGFFPDNLPGETWLVRMHCLLTPFCVDEDGIAAGENDLRLVGEVMRFFHEQPTFDMVVEGEHYLIQAIFLTLGLDQLNQLWSTQGDTVYRPSLLFEMSLAPVRPRTQAVPAPLVGGIGFNARATMLARNAAPNPATLSQWLPNASRLQPNTALEAWAPALTLVVDGVAAQSVSLALGSPTLAAFDPVAWVAGLPGAQAVLRWETWDAANGWQQQPPGAPFVVVDMQIDPANVAGAHTRAVSLPFDDHAGQMALYAEHTYVRGSDGTTLTVRSNPVLITLFQP